MNKNTLACLFEAYRRNEMADNHEKHKPLIDRWLGLGTATAYKTTIDAGLMRWWNGKEPTPRAMGWLCLTEPGIAELERLTPEFKAELKRMKDAGYDRSLQSQFMLAGGLE